MSTEEKHTEAHTSIASMPFAARWPGARKRWPQTLKKNKYKAPGADSVSIISAVIIARDYITPKLGSDQLFERDDLIVQSVCRNCVFFNIDEILI